MNKKVSSYFHMDEQVIFTMAGLAIVSLILLAFQYVSDSPCMPVKIQFKTDSLVTDKLVHFVAETKGGKNFSWKFGDGIQEDEQTNDITHSFKNAGRYNVMVLVDGECSAMQTIVINERPVMIIASLQPIVVGPDTALVHEPIDFRDASSTSTSWEWHFEENVDVDGRSREATYRFTTTGMKKIFLVVNNKPELSTIKYIMVIDKKAEEDAIARASEAKKARQRAGPTPAVVIQDKPTEDPITNATDNSTKDPEPAKKEEPPAPNVDQAQLAAMLLEVNKGSKSAADFSDYLCKNLQIKVSYQNGAIPFTQLCEELKKIKPKRIKSITVGVIQKNQNNCVQFFSVTVKKKSNFNPFD